MKLLCLIGWPREVELFLARYPPIDEKTGCRLWTHWKTQGYGLVQFKLKGKKHSFRAHRLSWEFFNERAIPVAMLVCHTCDTPSCVNPDHLFLGDKRDNAKDMVNKGRDKPRPGTLNPNAKLTEELVKQLREDARFQGSTEIGRKYGISSGNAGNIVARRAWKHVE